MPPFNFNEFISSRMYNNIDAKRDDLPGILIEAIDSYSANNMWVVLNVYIYNDNGTTQELRVWKSKDKYYIVSTGECLNPYKLYYELFTVRRNIALFDINYLLSNGFNVEEVAREELRKILTEKFLRGCASQRATEIYEREEQSTEASLSFPRGNQGTQSISTVQNPLETCVNLLASRYDNLKELSAVEIRDYYSILERTSILVLSRGGREHVCIVIGSGSCAYAITLVKSNSIENICVRSINEVKSIIERLIKEGFRLQLN